MVAEIVLNFVVWAWVGWAARVGSAAKNFPAFELENV